MKLIATTEEGDFVNFEVDSDETVENLKALLEVELKVPLAQQILEHAGKTLNNNQKLNEFGVQDGDMILVRRGQQSQGIPRGPGGALDPVSFLNYIRANPELLQRIQREDPELHQAIEGNNPQVLGTLLASRQELNRKREAEQLRLINMMNADPMNPEYQRKIEEAIRMENVNENMEQAMEHTPESFGNVTMLYIDCAVNGVPVKAFVDSGAQQTIMSVECAERCGIMRLVDTRFQGIAKGVGSARILGRVHVAPIKIGDSFFPCSFTILEGKGVDFLLGLDMLKRHQCSIDLRDNVLRVGDQEVRFLPESEIPRSELFDDAHPPNSLARSVPSSSTSSSSSSAPTSSTSAPSSSISQAPTVSVPSAQSAATFPEAAIEQLMGFGFSRDEVLRALTACGGNTELAASFLFGA